MNLSTLTIISMLALFGITIISTGFCLMMSRIHRTTQTEAKINQTATPLDTAQLKWHLQHISFSVAKVDEEVAALKADIIKAAHKHHLTVDKHDTQPESPFNTPQKREQLLKIVEKQKDRSTRVS